MCGGIPGSAVFDKARAIGLQVKDWQDVILVNMLGQAVLRRDRPAIRRQQLRASIPTSRAAIATPEHQIQSSNFINAALAGIGDGHNGGGPIWAIFDAEAVVREKWDAAAAACRSRRRLLLQRGQHRRARRQDRNEISARADAAAKSARTRSRATIHSSTPGADADFGKPKPLYKIATPPFYAAWATPVIHDTRAGLRINARCQVVDMNGAVIPGLYCGGESAGGFQHARPAARHLPGPHRRAKTACETTTRR